MSGKVRAISISAKKGRRKDNIVSGNLVPCFGLEGDAHGGKWHRQVSLLAQESIDFMRQKGLDVVAGNFAENITTEDIDLTRLPVGSHLKIGRTELIISQLGKICHTRCAIYHQAGDCVMPREGIFGVVLSGGEIKVGDAIEASQERSTSAAVIVGQEISPEDCEELVRRATAVFSPGFVRLDTITPKTGATLQSILKDLTETQKIDDIVIYDPTGTLGLGLAPTGESSSRIQRITTAEEMT